MRWQEKYEKTNAKVLMNDKRSIKGQEKYETTRADPDKNTDRDDLAH